ncbi:MULTISPECIES: DUF1350 family protein [unclassified Microcoleus]|uniref:DUF1350 family protein n=1 Tax=unclassified Microcoleus TaxID=2642155 RepID=UPI002FD3B50C
MSNSFKFQPVSFSWVAVHPQPKGVVQFIGGTFFGSLPILFYRYFLQQLFEEGYTVVALPFRFTFRHWPIAIGLLKEQEILRTELTKISQKLGYESEIYQELSSYFWVGHSLGCKYIALLEFLSDDRYPNIVNKFCDRSDYEQIHSLIENLGIDRPSIKDQPSLLIAPDISNTESAIPVRSLAKLLDKFRLGVLPTREQTQCFIANSSLFNLTAIISFDGDNIAGSINDINKSLEEQKNSDVLWLIQQLSNRKLPLLSQEIEGKHLEPIGIKIGNYIVDLNPWDKFIKPLKSRFLEYWSVHFLDALKKRLGA